MNPLEMPWDEIRREYETTRVSLSVLAVKFGMASKTTLVRRAKAEGWARNETAIGERQAVADAVLDKLAIPVTLDEALADVPYMPPHVGFTRAEPMPRQAMPFAAPATEEELPLLGERGPLDPNEVDLSSVGELDPVTLVTSRGSVDENAAALRRHAALAAEMQYMGLLLIRRVHGVLQAPAQDPEGIDAASETTMLGNLQRLIRVNPDKETLSGLMTTAVKVMEAGVKMERTARGLDPAAGGKSSAPIPAAPGVAPHEGTTVPPPSAVKQAIAMLDSMEPEMAMKMREWAVRVQREKREAEIAAAGGGQ